MGWDNYVEKIKRNWNKTVKSDDLVVIAGDVSWAMRLESAKEDFSFIESLNGQKVVIRGNHDYWWSTVKKIEEFFAENSFKTISLLHNSAIIFDEICICGTRGWNYKFCEDKDRKIFAREVGRLKASLDAAKQTDLEKIVFLHYPPVYGPDEAKEIIDLLLENNIKKCYYGHIHGNTVGNLVNKRIVLGDYKGINLQLVSGDYVDFTPVLVE